MKKYRFVLALLFVSLSFVLVPTDAQAALWEVPAGLNPGDTFRWAFVTSELTNAISDDIGYYNTFVDKVADAADGSITNLAGIKAWAEIDWRAIAATVANPDVYFNVGISRDDTIRLYNPRGGLVADNPDFIYDPVLQVQPDAWYTQYGISAFLAMNAWTGITKPPLYGGDPLGGEHPVVGYPGEPGKWFFWMEGGRPNTYTLPLYAISEELTVVPVPSALILGATGMLSATVGLKRLRRKHQE